MKTIATKTDMHAMPFHGVNLQSCKKASNKANETIIGTLRHHGSFIHYISFSAIMSNSLCLDGGLKTAQQTISATKSVTLVLTSCELNALWCCSEEENYRELICRDEGVECGIFWAHVTRFSVIILTIMSAALSHLFMPN